MSQELKTNPASPTPAPVSFAEVSREWLTGRLEAIEEEIQRDVVVIMGGIEPGLDIAVRMALERLNPRRESSLVILDTPGGYVHVAERIAATLRHFYKTVDFLIPNQAMSAGTVLALSGDAIWMDYFSRLGPIDPQVPQEGRMVPGLSYLVQYRKLIEKSETGALTEAELTLLSKLDLAELHRMELAAKLSVSLIKKWLSRHKFKDWEKNGEPVSEDKKQKRAAEIAGALNDHGRWGSHSRGIPMNVLTDELKLRISDYSSAPEFPGLKEVVWRYFWAALEYTHQRQFRYFAHSRSFI